MNSVGSGEMESWSSAGREEGNEALSSTNTYDGMPESASTGGVMQVRVLLSTIVQGDCGGIRETHKQCEIHTCEVGDKGELTATPFKTS
jgi:hypothetical protein